MITTIPTPLYLASLLTIAYAFLLFGMYLERHKNN